MASTVLPNGIIIPEKYSRDWYADLYHNWQELDNLLGGGTPKDGTLTIQKNGTTVGTFSANQATDETVNITVSDVNDATLTIQQNGTTVDTFTANSSTDKTVDITVPTKTSDLTNDSGFITEDNTKIPLAGSNQISGSLIPATTNAYDLGTSTNKWKSFNRISPGALSLPMTDYTTLDTTNFALNGSTNNRIFMPYDGWLNIRMTSCESYDIRNTMNGISYRVPNASGDVYLTIPVPTDTNMSIVTKCSIIELRAYKCLGNV